MATEHKVESGYESEEQREWRELLSELREILAAPEKRECGLYGCNDPFCPSQQCRDDRLFG